MNLIPEIQNLSTSFGKVTCEASWRWDTLHRPMPDYDLWYVWGGEGQVQLNGVVRSVGRGSCFLFKPGDITLGRHNPLKPLIVTYIHFSMKSLPQSFSSAHVTIGDPLVFETYLNRYVFTMLNTNDTSRQEAEMLLKLLLLQFARESSEQKKTMASTSTHLSDAIHEVANYVREHPGANNTLKALAERAGLSPRYFSIKFKESTGQTVEHFLIRTKIERAEHLLRFTGMNVSEVAEALGYSNIYFFSKQFKKFRGVSPSVTRNLR